MPALVRESLLRWNVLFFLRTRGKFGMQYLCVSFGWLGFVYIKVKIFSCNIFWAKTKVLFVGDPTTIVHFIDWVGSWGELYMLFSGFYVKG